MKGKLLYKETQSFRYTWSWWLVVLILAGTLAGFIIFQMQKWADLLSPGILITVVVTGGVIWLLNGMTLTTEIDQDAISYQYPPFSPHRKSIQKEQVLELVVRKANPISEFGGWGYRTGFGKTKALNVTGKWGLQITFHDGKKLFLGTQKPEALNAAIHALQNHWNTDKAE